MPEHGGAQWAMSGTSGPLDLLQRIIARMTVHHTRDEVLRAIAGGLVESTDAALARIWLYTTAESCPRCREVPRGDVAGGAPSLHLCASAGIFDGDAGPHHCVPLGMFLGGRVAETRQATLLNDLGSERRVRSLPWIAQHRLRAYAGYPLLFDDELEGVLGIFRVRPFDPAEFQVLGIFAAQAAIAIKNAALLEDAGRHRARLSEEKAYLEQEIQQERGSAPRPGEPRAAPPLPLAWERARAAERARARLRACRGQCGRGRGRAAGRRPGRREGVAPLARGGRARAHPARARIDARGHPGSARCRAHPGPPSQHAALAHGAARDPGGVATPKLIASASEKHTIPWPALCSQRAVDA